MPVSKLVDFPDGAQQYLKERYGFPVYSARHLKELVKLKKYPAPIKISERRHAIATDILDQHAARIISGAATEQSVSQK
jgi:hypothetical protein